MLCFAQIEFGRIRGRSAWAPLCEPVRQLHNAGGWDNFTFPDGSVLQLGGHGVASWQNIDRAHGGRAGPWYHKLRLDARRNETEAT